jgi:hypothetical protein
VDGVNHLQIFGRVTENPEKFGRAKKIRKLFFGKICTRTPPQTINIPNHAKTPQNPKFSDVIAIMDNQWYLQTGSVKKQPEICAKKSDQQKPANLTGFILFKMRLSRKQAF